MATPLSMREVESSLISTDYLLSGVKNINEQALKKKKKKNPANSISLQMKSQCCLPV